MSVVPSLIFLHPLAIAGWFFCLGYVSAMLVRELIDVVLDRREQRRRETDFLRINGGRRG